jgi:hypothetical protein
MTYDEIIHLTPNIGIFHPESTHNRRSSSSSSMPSAPSLGSWTTPQIEGRLYHVKGCCCEIEIKKS